MRKSIFSLARCFWFMYTSSYIFFVTFSYFIIKIEILKFNFWYSVILENKVFRKWWEYVDIGARLKEFPIAKLGQSEQDKYWK